MQKVDRIKIQVKKDSLIIGIFKSVMLAVLFMLLLTVIFSFVFLKYGNNENYMSYAAAVTFYSGFYFVGMVSSKFKFSNGWKSGLISGVGLVTVIAFIGVFDGIDVKITDFFKILLALFIGSSADRHCCRNHIGLYCSCKEKEKNIQNKYNFVT